MKYEDLSFKVTLDNGEEIECDIVSVVPNPNDKEEPYVVFTDYLLDDNNEFVLQYGKVIKENDDYVLKTVKDENIVSLIKEQMTDEIVNNVNEQINENVIKEDKQFETFTKKNDIGVDIEYTIVGYYENYRVYTDFISENSDIGIRIYVDKKDNNNYVPVDENTALEVIKKFNFDALSNKN